MRTAREATTVRVAAGEMTRSSTSLRDLITGGAWTCCSDVALVRRHHGPEACGHPGAGHHLTFTPHTWTNGMGVTANAHLVRPVRYAVYGISVRSARVELPRRDFMMRAPGGRPAGLDQPGDAAGWAMRSMREDCSPPDRISVAGGPA